MAIGSATVINEYGIHCRPSAVIARAMQDYEGAASVRTADGREARVDSVLALVGLAAHCGDTVTIEVHGPEEKETCRRLVDLFETNFDFPRTGDRQATVEGSCDGRTATT